MARPSEPGVLLALVPVPWLSLPRFSCSAALPSGLSCSGALPLGCRISRRVNLACSRIAGLAFRGGPAGALPFSERRRFGGCRLWGGGASPAAAFG